MKGLFTWLNKTKTFRDLTPQEFSWVLYDVGNSAYTMLACSLIPIWFKDLAIGTNPGQITLTFIPSGRRKPRSESPQLFTPAFVPAYDGHPGNGA